MEVKRIVRKAAAVAASASFVGATLLGAMAADLANYPAPFVDNGQFDAFIVVGANAQPMDIVGAVDIGASLQFALKKATAVSAGAADATVSDGYKLQKSSNKLNYEEYLADVQSDLTVDELPSVLADGKYVESVGDTRNNVEYTQELELGADNGQLVYDQDDDLAPEAGDYLLITKNDNLYTYTLSFDDDVEYNDDSSSDVNDDFKTSTINIQGKTYTITDVEETSGVVDKMTLLSGEAVLWLTQNQPITKTVNGVEHTVEVLDVTDNEDSCQIKVDDVQSLIDVDATQTINGVQIGVTNVKAIHAQLQDVDVCQVSVGASEVVLTDGDQVKVDDNSIEGSEANIFSTSGILTGFNVTYSPKELDDDSYLASGDAYTDPIFGSWKLMYGGVTADYEEYDLKTSGDKKATFTFLNDDAKEISLPLYYKESSSKLLIAEGKDLNDVVYADSNSTTFAGFTNECIGTSSVEDCEDMTILATDNAGVAHLFQITNINTDDEQLDVKDLTYGRTYNDVDYTDGSSSTLDLGSFDNPKMELTIDSNTDSVLVTDSIIRNIATKAGASIIDVVNSGANANVTINESNYKGGNDIADDMTPSTIILTSKVVDDEIQVDAALSQDVTDGGVSLKEDSDYNVMVTPVGTIVTVDDENADSVVVQMPKAEVYGNAFIAPIVAEISTAEGGIPTYTLSKLSVGAAKLDSEVSDATADNLIVVGGPCANTIAKQVLGITGDGCGANSGIAENTGMIKEVVQSTGKVALVVAGWEAMDTRRATRVLANYADYALSGTSVTVTGTSLADIQVQKSA